MQVLVLCVDTFPIFPHSMRHFCASLRQEILSIWRLLVHVWYLVFCEEGLIPGQYCCCRSWSLHVNLDWFKLIQCPESGLVLNEGDQNSEWCAVKSPCVYISCDDSQATHKALHPVHVIYQLVFSSGGNWKLIF